MTSAGVTSIISPELNLSRIKIGPDGAATFYNRSLNLVTNLIGDERLFK
jgi:hypothetical protein